MRRSDLRRFRRFGSTVALLVVTVLTGPSCLLGVKRAAQEVLERPCDAPGSSLTGFLHGLSSEVLDSDDLLLCGLDSFLLAF